MCRPDIDKLLRLLPPKSSRQTVLFSATFPANTKELCDFALRPQPVVVDCVGEDTEQTAKRVSCRIWMLSLRLQPKVDLSGQFAWQHDGNRTICIQRGLCLGLAVQYDAWCSELCCPCLNAYVSGKSSTLFDIVHQHQLQAIMFVGYISEGYIPDDEK